LFHQAERPRHTSSVFVCKGVFPRFKVVVERLLSVSNFLLKMGQSSSPLPQLSRSYSLCSSLSGLSSMSFPPIRRGNFLRNSRTFLLALWNNSEFLSNHG